MQWVMETLAKTERLGPIWLAPGISRTNVVTKIYASFIGVTMLTGMSFLQGYVLTEHLHIPREAQGTIAGDLTFWTEVTSLIMFNPFGVLSDRIGRRPIFIFGILMIGICYGLYPFATSVGELLVYRLLYGVGVAATVSMLSTITNDYPQEKSRGTLIGITSMLNVVGVIFMASGIARIPLLLTAREVDPVTAGQVMFLVATGLCIVTAIIARLGLKGGTPAAPKDRANTRLLLLSGLRAGKNPRIALCYASAFSARADMVIKGLFLALWAIHIGQEEGISPAEAMARFGVMIILMQITAVIFNPIYGMIVDRMNRVSALAIALLLAALGYSSMGIITSPLDMAALPYLIVVAIGSSAMNIASLSLVGQEAPEKERGSIIAMTSMAGTIGIMVFVTVGGRLFDLWGPWAPFVLAGALQAVLFVAAVIIRIVAPGQNMVEQQSSMPARAALGTAANPSEQDQSAAPTSEGSSSYKL